MQAVAEGLHRTYADILQQQVIDDQFAVEDAGARLGFPRKIDGFIPQAYRAPLRRKDILLDDEDAWGGARPTGTSARSSCGTSNRRTACRRRC